MTALILKYRFLLNECNPFDKKYRLFNKLMLSRTVLILLFAVTAFFPVNYLYQQSKKDVILAELSIVHDFFKGELSKKIDILPKINSMLPHSLENIAIFDASGQLYGMHKLDNKMFNEMQRLYSVYDLNSHSEPIFTENTNYFFYVIRDELSFNENIYILPKTYFLSELDYFNRIVFIIVGAITLGLLIFNFFYLRKLLIPLDVLYKSTKKIVLGNYSESDDYLGNDKIADIFDHVNVISKDLNSKKTFLSNYNMLLEKKFFELEQKKKKVEFQNNQIESDLRYAKQIQSELLSNYYENRRGEVFSWFSLLKPLGIVSGDFYNVTNLKIDNQEYTFFAVADCTGHGVQAALLTVMANNALTSTLEDQKTADVATILTVFNRKFVSSFSKNEEHGKIDCGLDVAIVAINHQTKQLTYGGAYRPCLIKRNGEIIQLKANRISIGFLPCDLINPKMKERATFKTHTFDLKKDDQIFMFSDGITDQFCCDDQVKFGSKRLIKLITEDKNKKFFDVKDNLSNELKYWQGSSIQTDDQLFIGIKIK